MDFISASPYSRMFWNEYIINPKSSDYNMTIDQIIEGPFIIDKMREAVDRIVKENILFEHVLSYENESLFWVKSNKRITLEVLSPPCDVDALIGAPFDLTKGPLCRFYLIKLDHEKYNLIIVLHHILIDGLSGQEFFDTLTSYYNNPHQGSVTADSPARLQQLYNEYEADVALLKKKHRSGDFWREMLADCPPCVDLPYIHSESHSPLKSAEVRFSLGISEWNELKKGLRHVTPFLVFKTLWAILIARQTQEKIVYIGYPVAAKGGEKLYVGAQVNTAVLPLQLKPHDTFSDKYSTVLEYTKALKTTDKIRHSKLPIDEILSHTNIKKLNVNFTQAFLKDIPLHFEGCSATINHRFNIDLSGSELLLEYQQSDTVFDFRLRYRTDLFDKQQMEEMSEQYMYLLRTLLHEPERHISRVPYLTPQQNVLFWQRTIAQSDSLPQQQITLLTGFENIAQSFPGRIALKHEGSEMSYAELERRSTALAGRIRCEYKKRCGHEMPVDIAIPLFVHRGINAVIGILAIMKAGAAYVPIDSNSPQQRLSYIIKDTASPIILTETLLQESLLHTVPECYILLIDKNDSYIESERLTLPAPDENNLAYIIYTSGTTGEPKGVLCEHRGAANMISSHTHHIFSDNFRELNCLQFASLAFDAHVLEVFLALNNGHCLCIASESQRLDLSLLTEQMALWKIDFCFLPPALLGTRPKLPGSVKLLVVGGESTSQEILDHYLACGVQIFNLYGPTEASVSTNINRYNNNGARNIGRAIENMQCYVVDEYFTILPVGVEGELYLAGVGLARGYLQRPELTRTVFIDNPFALTDSYDRMYYTGDRTRRLADGSLEYCGRKDQQVKIHGYRIELGEIESVIKNMPGIAHAVIVAKKEPSQQILGWYVLSPGSVLSPDDIIRYLDPRLPHYMIPSAIMEISSIPLTLSQKINYKALPEPAPIKRDAPFRAASNHLEEKLSGVFNRILNTDAGIDDHFYRLGGNSILAIKLCHEIFKTLGVRISVLTLNTYPTVAALSQYISSQTTCDYEKIMSVSGATVGPLSLQQSRLWFMDRLSPGNTQYVSPLLLKLPENTDIEAFINSIKALYKRHNTLRSLIIQNDAGEASQIITDKEPPISVQKIMENELSHFVKKELSKAFDLLKELPLRVVLYLIEGEKGNPCIKSLFVFHHSVFDGWSMDVLIKELTQFYHHFTQGTDKPADLPLQYIDYAIWQHNHENASGKQDDLHFWRSTLAEYQPLDLSADYARPAIFDTCGDNYTLTLSDDLMDSLGLLAQAEGVSQHAIMLSAFTLLLSRLTGQDDIIVGTPLANRDRPELENLIGFFANTLPLRNRVNDRLSVSEFIHQIADNTVQVQQHQGLSFEQLVDSVGLQRDFSHHPLFQVMFTLENPHISTDPSACFFPEDISDYEDTAKFDLTLVVSINHHQTRARFNYATALFKESTIRQFAAYYETILEQLIQNRCSPLQQIGLHHTEKTQQSAKSPFPAHQFTYSFESTLHANFMEYAQQHPDAIAVIDAIGQMSYGQLYDAAQHLSTQLRLQGGIEGDAIAILTDKGRQQPMAMLAIMMCGKAFLPMDKSWPLQRRLSIMAQAGINTVLTDNDWGTSSAHVVVFDSAGQALSLPEPLQLLSPIETAPDSLAYIIFTSGSTGKPKGVAIEHRSVVNMIEGTNRYFNVDRRDRSIALSALSFDLAIYDIFSVLSTGGAVVIPGERDRNSPETWYRLMMAHRVTLWLSAPALMELLLDYLNSTQSVSEPLTALRAVMVGGDWIATTLPARCRQWAPNSRFCSAGGATESAVFSILYDVPDEPILSVSIPYGKPLPHQRFYILDKWQRPLPAGVKGEIYIAGEGLARGYYRDEERTAQSFFWHEQLQERVYRTGDAGRFLSDGNIEFMGRIDQQVKINGYRIELGEIENVVMSYPAVTACCVKVFRDPQPCLVAYLVAGEPVDTTDLNQFLRSELPQYMLPKTYVQLESMPLTENGKIAKKALPEPEYQLRKFAAAETEWERTCRDIWGHLLKHQNLSVEDNFFSLGGNSILAIQACYQISQKLHRDVSLNEFGQHPTVRELCQHLGNKQHAEQGVNIPALNRDSYPLSFSQMQLWFIENINGGSSVYHVPMLFKLSEDVDQSSLVQALQTIVERHHILRSTICQQASPLASSTLLYDRLHVEFRTVEADNWQQQLMQDISRPFMLEAEIPTRATLFQVYQHDNSVQHFCLIVVHHLAFDGWSQTLFMQELKALYETFSTGRHPTLPNVALQYGDYAYWQQAYLSSERLEPLKAFWLQEMQDWQAMDLPLDYVRPGIFDHRGANYPVVLSESLTAQVEDFIKREGVTHFALYLSAFKLLLSVFSGLQDIIVGTPVANRPTAESHAVIGFFVNTLPLRSRINDSIRLSDFVHQVFNASLRAQEFQTLPLEKMIEILNVPRDLSRHPLFQVFFAMEDKTQNDDWPDWLEPQSLLEQHQTAKFDLVLGIHREKTQTQVVFNFATALFKTDTMACLATYYLMILEQIVNRGGSMKISHLSLSSPKEVACQRQAWQTRPPRYDFERAIHYDFIQQARYQPQATAIIDSQGELSYGDLYQAALTLSLQLRQNIDMHTETIAVMVDKGRAQIIAVLAVVMTGKAYLPLDKSWPESRRLDVITHSQTRAILTSEPWNECGRAKILLIDPQGRVQALDQPNPGEPVLPSPAALAYVIFTSGSTGVPKGVAIEHRGAVNSIIDTIKQLELTHRDRGLTLSALSFDISVFDIFGILSAGGTMIIPSEKERYMPCAWHQLMVSHRVTFWNSAPSVMTLLVEYLETGQAQSGCWPALRNVILVGEVISKQLPARIRKWTENCHIISTGGATESSIWSIIYAIPDTDILSPTIPYGKAMEHQRFYVLDRHMNVLPPCLPGEQYIGGAGVARGYYRNTEITAEKFIYHPELGERLYRTGDAGRYLPDGNLEFLGRMDFQVKINGYRIELGEIENHALASGAIKACCALVCKDQSQERLALYYVCDGKLNETKFIEYLSQRLPLYMLPNVLIPMAALPYNSSGKLDRKALPAPQARRPADYVAPGNALEAQLCLLWQDHLQCGRVGMTDDFFSLGGTSIMAISVCLKLSEKLNQTVPVIRLFQSRTLKNLLAAQTTHLVNPLIPQVESLPALWMIHPALVGVEVFHSFAQDLQGRMNAFGVDNYNLYHRPTVSSLSELAELYLQEMIANGLLDKPVEILGWSLGGIIALEIAAKLEARGVDTVSLYLLDSFYQQAKQDMPLSSLLPALDITGDAADRALAIAEAESTLSRSAISSKLRSTRVILFKALQINTALPSEIMAPLVLLPDNGLATICDHLRIIGLNCHHHNILECGDDILKEITGHQA